MVLWYGMVPFLPGDAIKIIMAWLVLPIGWKVLGLRASQASRLRAQARDARQQQQHDEVMNNSNGVDNNTIYVSTDPDKSTYDKSYERQHSMDKVSYDRPPSYTNEEHAI